jgi:hypothetical protein
MSQRSEPRSSSSGARTGSCRRRAAVFVVVSCALAACSDDEGPTLSPVVLSGAEMTDHPLATHFAGYDELFDARDPVPSAFPGCDLPVELTLAIDARLDGDVNHLQRVAPDGDNEAVVTGAWIGRWEELTDDPDRFRADAFRDLAREIDSPKCRRRPVQYSDPSQETPALRTTGTLTPIRGLPDGAVGYHYVGLEWPMGTPAKPASQLDPDRAIRRSRMQAWVAVGDYVVMMSLLHLGDSDPEASDLRELLNKAVAKVEANS